MNNRTLGSEWEEKAAAYLEARGMKILERNFRCRQGEIDLIGVQEEYLVFVEVKYRRNTGKGYASEAVDKRKQYRISRVAEFYCYQKKVGMHQSIRYDVVSVQGGEIEWIPNAFSHQYARQYKK